MFFFWNELPKYDELMKPVVVALQQLGGTAGVLEIDAAVFEMLQVPSEIIEKDYNGKTGRTAISYRLSWARTYLKKGGIIKSPSRGVWSLTEKAPQNADDIDVELIKRIAKQPPAKGSQASAAFEKLVLSVANDINKLEKGNYYELVTINEIKIITLPAFDNYKGPVVLAVKYSEAQNPRPDFFIAPIDEAASYINRGTVILATNFIVDRSQRQFLSEHALSYKNITVDVWGIDDIEARINPEEDYVDYYIEPEKAITSNIILQEKTNEEREKERAKLIEKLNADYSTDDLTLFLGAGVSRDAGIPAWPELVKKLVFEMINNIIKDKKLDATTINTLGEMVYSDTKDSPITQMRLIKKAFNDDDYRNLVHHALYQSLTEKDTALLKAITSISRTERKRGRLKSIVTYNFDDLIEQNLDFAGVLHNSICLGTDLAPTGELNIYHVHGYLPQDKSKDSANVDLIFSEDDYHRIYHDAYSWSNLTQLNAFRNDACLFIGCSFTDPNLRRLLDAARRDNEKPRHYAFMRKNSWMPAKGSNIEIDTLEVYRQVDFNIKETHFAQLGVNVIWVDDYDEIAPLLRKLLG